jgi:hypothetical protein
VLAHHLDAVLGGLDQPLRQAERVGPEHGLAGAALRADRLVADPLLDDRLDGDPVVAGVADAEVAEVAWTSRPCCRPMTASRRALDARTNRRGGGGRSRRS